MATIFLIRHAEPEVQGVFLGQLDPPLSQAGRDFATSALSRIESAVVYCSPLRRALETAVCLGSGNLQVLAELVEMNYGEWTGRTWSEIETLWGDLAREKTGNWLAVTPPGGESWKDLIVRAASAWRRIQDGPLPAAVVAHHAINAALASLIDGRDPLAFSQSYGGVVSIDYDIGQDRTNGRDNRECSHG